jgi:hypothetical protein
VVGSYGPRVGWLRARVEILLVGEVRRPAPVRAFHGVRVGRTHHAPVTLLLLPVALSRQVVGIRVQGLGFRV